ncbi:DarT ssDNA thymidine ADP-ribosyltransferase family protein [Frigoribacterium sp. 2-23]|uniref:DarT ssDNA thymidine ADP-ribosyltransferase family protein n=1 Tax=Frigoribacterium sp. 2-23 TaxID=3415006 RepID=UPI003C6F9855
MCAPRQRPEALVADKATAVRSPRTATSPRRPSTRRPESLRSTPSSSSSTPVIPTGPVFSALRAHHWTHIDNLESILEGGALRAGVVPAFDVSSVATRDARAEATTASGTAVAAHVAFALSPHSSKWDDVRTGATGAAWSDAARKARATDFVVFVVPTTALGDEVVVTDREATVDGARFATGAAEATPLLRRVSIVDADLLEPEVLVPGAVGLDTVTLIGVPNDKMRDRVKQLLVEVGGVAPRVAVYPPWFRPTEIEDEA